MIKKINSISNIVKTLLIIVFISVQFSGSALAILQNNVEGPNAIQIDKSNAAGGFVIENAQQQSGAIEGGLILYDVNNDKFRSVINEDGVLKMNVDGLGTLKRILNEDDLTGFGSYLQDATLNGVTSVINGSLFIRTSSPSAGYVLTADVNGLATWQSSTASLTSPSLVSVNPLDNSTGVSINTNLNLTFSTVVAEGNGNITIHKVSDNLIVETIDSNDSSKLTYSNNKVTVNPSTILNYLTNYYILIETGAIVSGLDVNDDWVGISSVTDWDFTTTSPANIAMTSLSPLDNSTGVSRTANFSITFNVPVNLIAGNVTFRKSSDNSIFDQFGIGSGQVTRSNGNQTVTFNPVGTMNYSNGYYIEIASGAIENYYTSGEYFAGYTGSTAWNFTVTGPSNLSATETFTLPANSTVFSSTSNVQNFQSSDTPVKNVTMTNDRVAGDSTVVVTFDLATNLPSSITLTGGTVVTFGGAGPVVPDSYANRYVHPTQEYSFYVDTSTYKLVISNEPSGFGVHTSRVITAIFRNY